MRKQYSYFFFENFDAEKEALEANNPLNPRNIAGRKMDVIISTVADNAPGSIISEDLEIKNETDLIDMAKDCGVLQCHSLYGMVEFVFLYISMIMMK